MPDLNARDLHRLASRSTLKACAWGVLAVVAAAISLATYADAANSPSGGTYILWWGPVVFGIWGVLVNAVRSLRLRSMARQVARIGVPTVSHPGVAPSLGSAAPDIVLDPDQELLVHTSADLVHGSWAAASRSDLVRGWLFLVRTPRGLRLRFRSDHGSGWSLYTSKIHHVAPVKSGLNVIVEVVYQHPGKASEVTTIVAPRDRIRSICAEIGFPIG